LVVVIIATTNWQGRMVEVPFKCVMQKCHTCCGDWHFTPTLNTMFQRLLSVMLPKAALFDAKNTDFASLSVRFKPCAGVRYKMYICHSRPDTVIPGAATNCFENSRRYSRSAVYN
jgi:hypothetical protein